MVYFLHFRSMSKSKAMFVVDLFGRSEAVEDEFAKLLRRVRY